MTTAIAKVEKTETKIARPLRVLVPLIQDELAEGDQAGLEHYRLAGEMLIEAKSQLQRGEWRAWLKRHFALSHAQATRYITLAVAAEKHNGNTEYRPRTLSEAVGDLRKSHAHRKDAVGTTQSQIREIVSQVDVKRLVEEQQSAEREAKMLRDLAFKIIDIGYRILAAKLHPDKVGGSHEAMARLNKVKMMLRSTV